MFIFYKCRHYVGNKTSGSCYIVMGLITIYTGVKNARDKENPSRVGTAVFWCALGIVLAFGRWIPAMIDASWSLL